MTGTTVERPIGGPSPENEPDDEQDAKHTDPSAAAGGGFGAYESDTTLVEDLGDMVRFLAKIVRNLPDVRLYASEVLRQAGILILQSSVIIWFMMGMIAAEISLEAHYLLKQLGAGGYTALFTSTANYTTAQEMWGWVLAAKVGCGLVAELGSMRISEEIDALDVMGFNSKAYLVGTRIVAIVVMTPFMFLAGFGLMMVVEYVGDVHIFHSVSAGGYLSVFWAFQTQADILLSLLAGLLMGTMIVLVGCYFGFNASGGPVGVGKATAKSMVINLIIVSVLGAVFQQLFFGALTRAPIGY